MKGSSPIAGTFTVSYGGAYSTDIPFDASAAQMKAALEALSSLGQVGVSRDDTNNGFKWTVSFVQNLGNLPLVSVVPFRYPVQSISTTGGSPTPLYGQLTLSFGGDSAIVPFDANALQMQTALESMPSVGSVEVSRQVYDNQQYTWHITFRSIVSNPPLFNVDYSQLQGTNAAAAVTLIIAGDNSTLTGPETRLSTLKKVPGKPDYLAGLTFVSPGNYTTQVSLLTVGGLEGLYYDNQWFYGQPSIDRIDSQISFDWGTGLITQISSDYVSIRWAGKFMAPKGELTTFYLKADDFANLYFNHTLLVNASSVCCIEYRASIALQAGVYYDFVLEYQQLTGSAAVSVMFSTPTIRKQVVPSSYFFSAQQIVGSPYNTVVVPGAADYPYTTAYGPGLTAAVSGFPAVFYVQTKDAYGNNQTLDYENYVASDLLTVQLTGVFNAQVQYYPDVEYIAGGLFKVSYTALRSGNYVVSVSMGNNPIQCGLGQANACSPFALTVSPGPTDAATSEFESPASQVMDSLVEGVAGQYGTFYIQAKDVFGNNRNTGGDQFQAIFTLLADPSVQYRGSVNDNGDGTYQVYYTVSEAGVYSVQVTLNSEELLGCVAALPPYVFSRVYDGVNVYATPSFCTSLPPRLTIVHGQFNAATSTYVDGATEALAYATVGITNSFVIESRDTFGNLRRGDNTTHSASSGDGSSDYFLVEFYQQSTGDLYYVSTAIDNIVGAYSASVQYFRFEFAGRITLDIPSDISAHGLEAVLEGLFDFQLDVRVTKTIAGSPTKVTWSVQFLSMLDDWQSTPLSVLPPSSGVGLGFFDTLQIVRPASKGVYPVSFTLWNTGTYAVSITSNGIDIQGSPSTTLVSDAPVDPTASIATGNGLVGGFAGQSLTVQIQARDTRQLAVQYLTSSAAIVPYVQEVQSIQLASSAAFTLTFRGATTATITPSLTTYGTLKHILVSIGTLGGASSFSILDSSSNVLDSSSAAITSTALFYISFAGTQPSLFGSLPVIVASSSSVAISRSVLGDAPFRYEVQVVSCSSNSSSVATRFYIGTVYTAALNASATLSEVGAALSTLGYGTVTATSPSGGLTLCSGPVFVEFNYKGDVPLLLSTSASVVASSDSAKGALSAIYPLEGSFALAINGETTASLGFDATASEVSAALDALYSIGTVTVVKDSYGVAYTYDGVTPLHGNSSLFSVWTVAFDSVCNGTVNGVPSSGCPATLGNLILSYYYTPYASHLIMYIYIIIYRSTAATEGY